MATGAICLFVGVGTGVVALGVAGCWLVRVLARRLLARAGTDPLTGLPGRAVAERLLDEVARSRRPMTVALADADQLSTINGVSHADGDRYLIAVARRLCGALAGQGRVVRFGGDEFVLVTALSPIALRSRLEAAPPVSVLIGDLRIQPRVSVGICATAAGDPRRALTRADQAGHTAKRLGGDRVLIFDPVRDAPVKGGRPRLDEALNHGGLLRLSLTLPEARTVQEVLVNAAGRGAPAELAIRIRDLIRVAEVS